MAVLEAGKLYKKLADGIYIDVTDKAEYQAPALSTALEVNNTTPNEVAATFIQNLETNSLSVSNNTGTGPKVEILKTGALGLHVNDGTADVLRAYVGTSGNFTAGDVVIGSLTGPNDLNNKGLMWDKSAGVLVLRGRVSYLDYSSLTAGSTSAIWRSRFNWKPVPFSRLIPLPVIEFRFPFAGSVRLNYTMLSTGSAALYIQLDEASGVSLAPGSTYTDFNVSVGTVATIYALQGSTLPQGDLSLNTVSLSVNEVVGAPVPIQVLTAIGAS